MKKRVLIIGLDGAEPALIFDRWRDKLPNFSALMENGLYGPLASTEPPVTVPAWASMLSSKDPGQLGLYGFRNRLDHAYRPLAVASSTWIKEKTLDMILSRRRLSSIMLGVPLSYPPRPLRGLMVSGPLTPGKDVVFTYPPGLARELDQAAGGEYIIDAHGFRTTDKKPLLDRIIRMTESRFKVASHLMTRHPWDFFMMVEMGPDRIHHGFWRYFDPAHKLFQPGHELEPAVLDYYRLLDGLVGRLVDRAPRDCLVMVVSDHGGQAMDGGFALNRWLGEEGLLTLKDIPGKQTALTPEMIDWSRTRAWGEGGYYGRIFFNVAGREPQGVVAARELESFSRELREKIENLKTPEGAAMGNRVLTPQDIYREVNGAPPDLLVYFGDLKYRSLGGVGGAGGLFSLENDTGPDDANHSPNGIAIMSEKGGAGSVASGFRTGLSLYDVAPTVLNYLGLDVPADMIGRVI
ncbi:MAG: alkaline phosphatase family protein [Pseudomonadota bacterium]